MFYQVTVRFDGNTIIHSPYEVKIDPYIIQVSCDEKSNVNKLSVRKQVLDYKQYLPQFIRGNEKNLTFHIPHNPHHKDIINLIQYLEALGSIWFNVKKIHWDTPLREWVPENDDEKKHLTSGKIDYSREYTSIPIEMPSQRLIELIQKRDQLNELVIPLSFYREGSNAYCSFQYIDAFRSFYFFLEGLFSDGKSKNDAVKEKFKVSPEIRQAIETTLKSFHDPYYAKHLRKLDEFRTREQCKESVDGIIELIVKIRGKLHHYSVKSTQKVGHPLNQQEFETMSYLMMSISTRVAVQLIIKKIAIPPEGQTNIQKSV